MPAEKDPLDAELEALIAEGRKNLAEAESKKTPSPLELEMTKQAPENAAKTPSMPIGSEHKVGDIEQPEQSAFAKWGDDQMAGNRVFASEALRGWPETIAAKIKGTTREDEVAETEIARERLGKTTDAALSFAGQVGPYLAGGGAGGIIRAAGGSAVTGLTDLAVKQAAEGEMPDAEEAVLTAVFAAGGGALGNAAGKGMSGLWSKLTAGKEPLPPYVQRSVQRMAKEVDAAGRAMDRSGLMVKGSHLNALSAQIERKLAGKISPEGTPKAWMALNRMKSMFERGEDLSVRSLNNLRRGISEIKGKNYEQDSVNEIGAMMNQFMKNLPNNKNAVAAGDAKAGVEGWREMNKTFQKKLKLDTMAKKMAIAEAKASTGKVTIDRALQDEFSKWTTTERGIKEFANIFTPEEQALLRPLTEGTITTQSLNKLDRTFGGGWLNTAMRVLRSSAAHSAAGPAARAQAGQAFGELPGGIAPNMSVAQAVSRAGQATGASQGVENVDQAQTTLGALMGPQQ